MGFVKEPSKFASNANTIPRMLDFTGAVARGSRSREVSQVSSVMF